MRDNNKYTTTFGGVTVTFTLPKAATLREEGDLISKAIDHVSDEIAAARAAGFNPISATANESGAWVSCEDCMATGGAL